MKRCKICNTEKDLDNYRFYISSGGNVRKWHTCKDCERKKRRKKKDINNNK